MSTGVLEKTLTLEKLYELADRDEEIKNEEGDFIAKDLLRKIKSYKRHCTYNNPINPQDDFDALSHLPKFIQPLAREHLKKYADTEISFQDIIDDVQKYQNELIGVRNEIRKKLSDPTDYLLNLDQSK